MCRDDTLFEVLGWVLRSMREPTSELDLVGKDPLFGIVFELGLDAHERVDGTTGKKVGWGHCAGAAEVATC